MEVFSIAHVDTCFTEPTLSVLKCQMGRQWLVRQFALKSGITEVTQWLMLGKLYKYRSKPAGHRWVQVRRQA